MALPTRIGRLRLPVLCYVVRKAALKDGDVEKAVTDAIAGGATMVRVSGEGMTAGELLDTAPAAELDDLIAKAVPLVEQEDLLAP